jgi:hypothetical protein
MTVPLPITIHTVGHCQECGAVVHDEVRHFEWHAAQQPADPVPAPDPWEEGLASWELIKRSEWHEHLSEALRHIGRAIRCAAAPAERRPGELADTLELTASHIRLMAPQGTVWRLPRSDDNVHVRERLRSVVRMLVDADQYDSDELRRDRLSLAEANLHELWLATPEAG